MKIVHIYKDYFPVLGGMENHIKVLAQAHAAQGHEVCVLVNAISGQPSTVEQAGSLTVVRVRRQLNVQSAPISALFPGAVRRYTAGADIAHLHAPYPIGEMCNLWFGRAKRTIITWQSDIVRQKTLLRVYGPVLKRVIRQADRVIASSQAYARTSPWLQTCLDKCTVVPLGVDVGRFDARRDLAAIRATRERLGVRPGQLMLLSAGRLRYYKGMDDMIRALPSLPDAVFAIVGIGPMEAAWRALAVEMGVADRVLFAGEVTDADLAGYYQAADVFVLPANVRAEAFGTVILEAMACGLPVISTEVGTATSWINQDGQTGFVTPPMDPPALAAAVGKMRNPETRAAMGQAARQRVLDEFTDAKMIERVMAVYRSVLAA